MKVQNYVAEETEWNSFQNSTEEVFFSALVCLLVGFSAEFHKNRTLTLTLNRTDFPET